MKKTNNSKKTSAKKSADKVKDSDELRKPAKLKPLKEKGKQSWKHNLDEEDDDFKVEDDIKFDTNFDDDEEEEDFYSEDF